MITSRNENPMKSPSDPPWVNFIKILRKAFTRQDPKSTKKTDDLTDFSALLGHARKMFVKLINLQL